MRCCSTGRVKLVLNRQSSRMTAWNSMMSCICKKTFVNSLSGTNGFKSPFYRFSGSAFPVCVHGSPLCPFKPSPCQLPAQSMTDTHPETQTLAGQVSVSLGISHVSEQREACGTSKKNQHLKSHLSYFALKPTLQRRAMENKVFFLNCVCFFL